MSPEGDEIKKQWYANRPPKPEEFEAWSDAQLFSVLASQEYPKFKDMIYPIEEVQNKIVLKDMWRFINLVRRTHSTRTAS